MGNFDEPIDDVDDVTASDSSRSPNSRRHSATFSEEIENAHIELQDGLLSPSVMLLGGSVLVGGWSDSSEIQVDPSSDVSSVADKDEVDQNSANVTMDTAASDSSYSATTAEAMSIAHEHALDFHLSLGLGGHRDVMMFQDRFRDPYDPRPGNEEEDLAAVNLEKPVEEKPSAFNTRGGGEWMLSKSAYDACSSRGITMTKRRWRLLALGMLLTVFVMALAIGLWASASNGGGENDINVDILQKGKDGEEPETPRDSNGEVDGEVPVVTLKPTPSPVTVVSNLSPLVSPVASPSQQSPSLLRTPFPSLSPSSLLSLSPTLVPSEVLTGSSPLVAMSSRTCDTGNVGDGATVETIRFLYSADISDSDSHPKDYSVPIQLGILDSLETTELLTCRVLDWIKVNDKNQRRRRKPRGSQERTVAAESFIQAEDGEVWYKGQVVKMELTSFPSVNQSCVPTFPGTIFCTIIENVLVFTTDAETDEYGLAAFKEVVPDQINNGTYIPANSTSVVSLSYKGVLSWDVKDLRSELYGDASWMGPPSTSPSNNYSPSPSITSMPTEDPSIHPTEVQMPRPTDRAPRTYSPTPTPSATVSSAPSSSQHPTNSPTPYFASFSFYVMGDVPYRKEQYDKLIEQLEEIKGELEEHRGQFIVHVGDTMHAGRSKCNENGYEKVRKTMLKNSPLPTMILAGDNDWNDCPEPGKAWKHVQNYYIGIEKDGWEEQTNALGIYRNEAKPEYFAFEKNGVLFVSVHIVGGIMTNKKEWDARIDYGLQWVKDNVWEYNQETQKLRAVVIFGHGRYSGRNDRFFHDLKGVFMEGMGYRKGLEIPVLYIHGDGHKWWIGSDLSAKLKWDMFRTVMVDQGVAARPLRVHVKGTGGSGYSVERPYQHVLGDGLFKLDRRGGLYKRTLIYSHAGNIFHRAPPN